ncbi:GntR family transcriptional regulator [Streptomyces sp. NPDC017056]|uniref:GntR family transcriptional regulator n=1 Tax=Streptomyces sp. NPDC017056 TaxID=3364973 RepID=UPI0037A9CF65
MPETPTDPHRPRAPYMRVLEALTAAITAGTYGPGEAIPSEAELCREYGVARETARRAVRMLRERGLVETEWGKGSRVRTDVQLSVRDQDEPAGEQ